MLQNLVTVIFPNQTATNIDGERKIKPRLLDKIRHWCLQAWYNFRSSVELLSALQCRSRCHKQILEHCTSYAMLK